MSLRNILIAVSICLLLATCKKKDYTNSNDATLAKLVTILNLQDGAVLKYQESYTATHDSLEAIIAMANWCLEQDAVETIYMIDHSTVRVKFKNGLYSPIAILQTDANGIPLTRGGLGGGAITQLANKTAAGEHLIGNDSVMIFLPFEEEFYHGSYPFMNKFTSAKHKLKPTLLLGKAADLNAIHTFPQFGFIIIDSHGTINGFQIITKVDLFDAKTIPGRPLIELEQIKALIMQQNNVSLPEIENGELEFSVDVFVDKTGINSITYANRILVTENYIRKLPHLNKAIVFGNHCYSGYTFDGPDKNNMSEAWKSIGAVSYYGYAFIDGQSGIAYNKDCSRLEDSLITNLIDAIDSTGIAHLANNTTAQIVEKQWTTTGGVQIPPPPRVPGQPLKWHTPIQYNNDYPPLIVDLYFEHFFDPEYKYANCGDSLMDSRDGQKYATVCIGEQVWMAENLRYNVSGSKVYGNNASNEQLYGRLYTNSMASDGGSIGSTTAQGIRGICPQNWHLPSRYDLDKLIATLTALNGGTTLGIQLKSENQLWLSDATIGHAMRNKSGFNALPGGLYDNPSGFTDMGNNAAFWVCSGYNQTGANHVALFRLSNNSADIDIEEGSIVVDLDQISCRCVKD